MDPLKTAATKPFEKVRRNQWLKLKSTDEGGDCWIQVGEGEADTEEVRMCSGFQVADVKKTLLCVKRIVETGTSLAFGPRKEAYIKHD